MKKIIIPVPFAYSTYGQNPADTYKNILGVQAANSKMSEFFPSNLLTKNCQITDPISFQHLPDTKPHLGQFIDSAADMQQNLAGVLSQNFSTQNQYLIIGGDHTVSIGTGLGLSKNLNMEEIGLIWVDAHGDCNTPETSLSKCITGYPVAVNCGLGANELVNPYNNNHIKNVVYIGIRDIDQLEQKNLQKIQATTYSVLEIEQYGISTILQKTLEKLKHCKYIWLSIDIDSLDSSYFLPDQTDVPVPGGLTPRELLYITNHIQASGKLLITEITQLNNVGPVNPLTVLCSRIAELSLGLGSFRYNKSQIYLTKS
jgi:arginase